jgi:iron complex outermembrane receptor protein
VNPWQVFAHDEWHISSATVLNIGGMFENNGMNSQDFSPRASLSYHFTPQQTVRVGISAATRSPAMFEAYVSANNTYFGGAYVPPIESLRPEHVTSREVAYLGEFRSLGMTVDARAYVDQVTDLIWWDKFVDPTNSSYPDSYKNLLAAEYRGLETTVKYHWDEGQSFLSANLVVQSVSARLSGTPTQYNNPTVYPNFDDTQPFGEALRSFYQREYLNQFAQTVPAQSGSLLWSQRFANQWQVSAGYYYRSLVRVADVSTDVTPEYRMRRIDVRVAKRLNESMRNTAEVALVIQNLTQDQYTNYGTLVEKAAPFFTQRAWLTSTISF